MRKIVMMSSAWSPERQDIPELDCMTQEERTLFDKIVGLITDWKSKYCGFIYNNVSRL